MRFASWVCSCLLIVGACPLLGCSSESRDEPAAWAPPAPPIPETSITFESSDQLGLGLREERALNVLVDPPGPHEVNFVLLGSSLDATLDRATAKTNHEGRASVVLRGPNKSTTFRVRAWLADGAADEIHVSTSGDGFASVELLPNYMGNRPITEWKASIVARATCADVAPLLPAEFDGALVATATAGEPLIVPNVPVGPSLAVTVRAGEFAWGCSDASKLVAGETMIVKVNVIDKPIEIGETNLDVTFKLDAESTAYYSLVESTSKLLVDSVLPTDEDAGKVLLDSIAARVPEAMLPAFGDARSIGAWDSLVTTQLAVQMTSLRDTLTAWSMVGWFNEPPELVARLTALPGVPGSATLSPIRFGSVAAQDAGMPAMHLAKLSVDTGDVIHLGGSFFWLPTRYLGGVIENWAEQQGTPVADALSVLVECDLLGQTLVGFDTCDANCLAGLCDEALADRWQDALDASAKNGDIGVITVAAAATASVDDSAVPLSFQGSWLGNITDGKIAAKISNAEISAKVPEQPPTP